MPPPLMSSPPAVAAPSATAESSTLNDHSDAPEPSPAAQRASTSEIIVLDDEEEEDDDASVEVTEDDYVDDEAAVSTSGKRKAKDSKSATNKKSKLSAATAKEKKAKPAAAKEKKEKAAKVKEAPPIVELKNNKFTLKQKPISSDNLASTMRAKLAFNEYCTTLAKDLSHSSSFLQNLPAEHLAVIARLVHESDKTLAALSTAVQKALIEYIAATLLLDEDSQEVVEPKIALTARFPVALISTLIEQIASRVDYGLDFDDVPADVRGDLTEIPTSLQLLRWEVADSALLPSELEGKLAKRKVEREEGRSMCQSLFLALSDIEQTALLSHVGPKKGRPSLAAIAKRETDGTENGDGESGAVASESGSKKAKEPKVKVKKEKKADSDDEEKVALKIEKLAEKERKRVEKGAKDAIRDEKKAKKAAEEAEKEAIKTKKANALKASSNLLSGFFKKAPKSASPAPASLIAGSSPHGKSGNQESDFARVFREFNIRHDVQVAPVNRFSGLARRQVETGHARGFEIQMDGSVSLRESIDEFLAVLSNAKIQLPKFASAKSVNLSSEEISLVQGLFEAQLLGDGATQVDQLATLVDRKQVVEKLLIFHKDARPGYLGTFSKNSRIVGRRNPFTKDPNLFDYDYDSEGDWNEVAASVIDDTGSAGERSADEEDTDGTDLDDWLAGDNEVDFEEGHVRDSQSPEPMNDDDDVVIMGESIDEAKKRRRREQEKKIKRHRGAGNGSVLQAVIRGPAWEKQIGVVTQAGFETMKVQFLNDASSGIDPYTFVSKSRSFQSSNNQHEAAPKGKTVIIPTLDATQPTPASDKPKAKAKPSKPLPLDLMSRFVRLIHGSKEAKPQLRDTIYAAFKDEKGVTKAGIDVSFQQVGSKKGKDGVWFIEEAVLARYPLENDDKMEVD